MRAGAALALAGCGSGEEAAGALEWAEEPRVFSRGDERVLSGQLRNASLEPVEVTVTDVAIIDGDGDDVAGSAIFLEGFVHGLYPPTREPERLPEGELKRTGRLAKLAPGESAPFTAAWRAPSGAPAERIDYGAGSLPIP